MTIDVRLIRLSMGPSCGLKAIESPWGPAFKIRLNRSGQQFDRDGAMTRQNGPLRLVTVDWN